MEGQDQNLNISIQGGGGGGGGVGNGGGNSRWNPTKEQIDILESLYKQGLRTPSAEQIQQITHRLRSHGSIEGKNVFYWFQNHKARQRQKQKLDHHPHVSYHHLNRFIHKPSSFPPTCPNVVCSPFYMPYPEMGICQNQNQNQQQQQPKVLLPRSSLKRRSPVPLMVAAERLLEKNNKPVVFEFDQPIPIPVPIPIPNPNLQANYSYIINPILQYPTRGCEEECMMNDLVNKKETLELFPMHPSGNSLQPNSSSSSPSATKCVVHHNHHQEDSEDRTYQLL